MGHFDFYALPKGGLVYAFGFGVGFQFGNLSIRFLLEGGDTNENGNGDLGGGGLLFHGATFCQVYSNNQVI